MSQQQPEPKVVAEEDKQEAPLFFEIAQSLWKNHIPAFLHSQEIPNCFLPASARKCFIRKIESERNLKPKRLNRQKGVVGFAPGHQEKFMYKHIIPVTFYHQTNCAGTK